MRKFVKAGTKVREKIWNGEFLQIIGGVDYRVENTKVNSYASVVKTNTRVTKTHRDFTIEIHKYQQSLKKEIKELKHKVESLEVSNSNIQDEVNQHELKLNYVSNIVVENQSDTKNQKV